jgi:hypothetical protein
MKTYFVAGKLAKWEEEPMELLGYQLPDALSRPFYKLNAVMLV